MRVIGNLSCLSSDPVGPKHSADQETQEIPTRQRRGIVMWCASVTEQNAGMYPGIAPVRAKGTALWAKPGTVRPPPRDATTALVTVVTLLVPLCWWIDAEALRCSCRGLRKAFVSSVQRARLAQLRRLACRHAGSMGLDPDFVEDCVRDGYWWSGSALLQLLSGHVWPDSDLDVYLADSGYDLPDVYFDGGFEALPPLIMKCAASMHESVTDPYNFLPANVKRFTPCQRDRSGGCVLSTYLQDEYDDYQDDVEDDEDDDYYGDYYYDDYGGDVGATAVRGGRQEARVVLSPGTTAARCRLRYLGRHHWRGSVDTIRITPLDYFSSVKGAVACRDADPVDWYPASLRCLRSGSGPLVVNPGGDPAVSCRRTERRPTRACCGASPATFPASPCTSYARPATLTFCARRGSGTACTSSTRKPSGRVRRSSPRHTSVATSVLPAGACAATSATTASSIASASMRPGATPSGCHATRGRSSSSTCPCATAAGWSAGSCRRACRRRRGPAQRSLKIPCTGPTFSRKTGVSPSSPTRATQRDALRGASRTRHAVAVAGAAEGQPATAGETPGIDWSQFHHGESQIG